MPIQIVSVVENIVVFLYLLLIKLLCVKDTVLIIMATTVMIKSVNNAYKTLLVDGKVQMDANKRPVLVIDEDKSLLRLASPVEGLIKDDDGNYIIGQKSELSLFNVVVRKLLHMGLEQLKMRAILEAHLDELDDNLSQCRSWLRNASVDIEVVKTEDVNKETGVVTTNISYNFSNVHLAIPEDEQFLMFTDYVSEKGYNEFMVKILAKKFGIEL